MVFLLKMSEMNFKISEYLGGTSVFPFFHLQYLYKFGPIKSYELRVIMTLRYFVWTDLLSLYEFLEDFFFFWRADGRI